MPADNAYENANYHAAFNKVTTMAIGEEDGGYDVVILIPV